MNGSELYATLWGLRTNPLSPHVDADGVPLDPALVHDTLDPTRDARIVRYYFDHYDWSASQAIVGLSKDHAFQTFTPPDDSLLVMICGARSHGLRSLVNLILYKIHQQAGQRPLVVDVELEGRNQPENVKACAELFIYAYTQDPAAQPARADLLTIFNQQAQGRPSGDRGYYSKMFQILRQEIRPHTNRPFVLRVTGGDHYDTWETIYNSTHRLFNYIIVTSSFESYVEASRNALGDRITVIRAGGLDRTKTAELLRDRLDAERLAGRQAAGLAPFSEEALDQLFEKGSAQTPVKLDITLVKRILRHALDAHARELAEATAAAGLDTARTRPPHELLISADRIRRSGLDVNRGSR